MLLAFGLLQLVQARAEAQWLGLPDPPEPPDSYDPSTEPGSPAGGQQRSAGRGVAGPWHELTAGAMVTLDAHIVRRPTEPGAVYRINLAVSPGSETVTTAADYIDYALPGVNVWSADPAGGGRARSGTSYAVPHMVALASQTLAQRAASRDALLSGRLAGLADLGDPGRDPVFGFGKPRFDLEVLRSRRPLLNIEAAISTRRGERRTLRRPRTRADT